MSDSSATQFNEKLSQAQDLFDSGEFQAALQSFLEARQLNELEADALEGMGMSHFMLGEYDQAVEAFREIIRVDPRRTSTFINLGAAYSKKGDFAKAAEELRKAVQVDRNNSAAYYNLGIAYRQMKQWGLAVPAYKEAIRIDPNMVEAYQNLGNVYLEMHNYPQAQIQFKKALELRPGFQKAKLGLEKAEQAVADSKKAFSPFGRLVDQKKLSTTESDGEIEIAKMSIDEQVKDRMALYDLSGQLKSATKRLMENLTSELETSIHFLAKNLSLMKGDPQAFIKSWDRFRDACRSYSPVVKDFHLKVREIRTHEAQIKGKADTAEKPE